MEVRYPVQSANIADVVLEKASHAARNIVALGDPIDNYLTTREVGWTLQSR